MRETKRQKYTVTVDVTRATGFRTYIVEATTPEEAKAAVLAGEARCDEEQLEVEETNDPDDWDVTETEA